MPAANNALPKLGLNLGTFTVAMWQLQLWAGLVLISFTVLFQLQTFNLSFPPGWTIIEYPNFGNADR